MRRFFSLFIILLPIGIATLFLFLPAPFGSSLQLSNGTAATNSHEQTPHEAQRLLFLLQYIGVDYNGAVRDGKVIDEFEYREMTEFCQTILTSYQQMPIVPETATMLARLEHLQHLIAQRAAWSEVIAVTGELIPALARQLNVIPYPVKQPDLASGKRLYAENCADCHGSNGDGRGPSSTDLNPPPSNFNDATRLQHLTPYQFYNAITFGVDGTAMPTFSEVISSQERWDIAFYLMTIKQASEGDRPLPKEKFSLRELATLSNAELARRLAMQRVTEFERSPAADSILQSAFVDIDLLRRQPPRTAVNERLAFARQELEKSLQAYQSGDSKKAGALALEAYVDGIENIELELQAADGLLKIQLEKDCARYRTAIAEHAARAQINSLYRDLQTTLEKVDAALSADRSAWGFAFAQAGTIILREGSEAALLLGLMLTYLTAAGYHALRRYVVIGGVVGIILGVLTWGLAQGVIKISPLQREALEGLTSLLAAAVLFSVSLWIIHNADVQRWKNYIRSRAENAVGTGSKFTLAFAAFLAVYREAFETVLFYEVLWMKSTAGHAGVISGFIAGAIILAVLMFAIVRFGLRIPLKPFFAITGVMLGTLVFVFVGYGIRELQNIGWIKETTLAWDVQWQVLEIYPTIEGVGFQIAVVLAFLLGWLFTKWEQVREAVPTIEVAELS